MPTKSKSTSTKAPSTTKSKSAPAPKATARKSKSGVDLIRDPEAHITSTERNASAAESPTGPLNANISGEGDYALLNLRGEELGRQSSVGAAVKAALEAVGENGEVRIVGLVRNQPLEIGRIRSLSPGATTAAAEDWGKGKKSADYEGLLLDLAHGRSTEIVTTGRSVQVERSSEVAGNH